MNTLNTVYLQVVDSLLEPGGLTAGIWSVQEFLDAFVDVATDFLQRSALYKKLDAVEQFSGTSQYTFDDWVMDLQAMFSNEKFLFRGDVDDLDLARRDWVGKIGTPREWHDDQLPPKVAELFPAPSASGNQVETTAINGYYGTLSGVTNGDMTFSVTTPFFGTIASNAGSTYLETGGPFFGTIASMVESKTNVMAAATCGLWNLDPQLATAIEHIHASFLWALKYGVLAKLWSKAGDGKNDAGAKYASERYEEAIMIAKAISMEELLQEAA